jgi:hypothetical protein
MEMNGIMQESTKNRYGMEVDVRKQPPIDDVGLSRGKILETDGLMTTLETFRYSKESRKMAVIIASPGLGKTTAATLYQAQNPNVVICHRVQESMTQKEFWMSLFDRVQTAVQDEIGFNASYDLDNESLYRAMRSIAKGIKALSEMHGEFLLIIDEGGKLKPKQLEHLHELRDDTKNYCGIVIMAPEYFETNLNDWVKKDLKGMPEIYRRINVWRHLKPPTAIEKVTLCKSYGVTDKETIEELISCRNYAALIDAIEEHLYTKQLEES